jgi:beta-glucosidase
VLLKNENHLLPIEPRKRVLVAGDGADNIPMQSGGWTITWQGTGTSNRDFPHAESIWQGIAQAVRAAGGEAELSSDGRFKQRPDVAIVVYGESPYAEFQGDMSNLAFSPGSSADLELLKRLRAERIPVVSVFLSGRPLWVNAELNASDAFIAAWLPGSEGEGVADVLFRKPGGAIRYDFRGRLSFSWPSTSLQFGTDSSGRPLFPLGYGLSYSSNGDLADLPQESAPPQAIDVSTKVFFADGRPGAGWHWMAESDVTPAEEVRQEDARALHFSGDGPALVGIAGGSPVDLSRQTNGQLSLGFDYRVDEPPSAPVTITMGCGARCAGAVSVERELREAPLGRWRHLEIPLACFASAGADMHRIVTPFAVATQGRLVLSVANVDLQSGSTDPIHCIH